MQMLMLRAMKVEDGCAGSCCCDTRLCCRCVPMWWGSDEDGWFRCRSMLVEDDENWAGHGAGVTAKKTVLPWRSTTGIGVTVMLVMVARLRLLLRCRNSRWWRFDSGYCRLCVDLHQWKMVAAPAWLLFWCFPASWRWTTVNDGGYWHGDARRGGKLGLGFHFGRWWHGSVWLVILVSGGSWHVSSCGLTNLEGEDCHMA